MLKELWNAITWIASLTVMIFICFWGTMALTGGNIVAAIWVVAGAFGLLGIVRVVCAVLDSNWYWQHRHDRYDDPLSPQPLEDKGFNEILDDRLSRGKSDKVRPDRLHQLDDFVPRVVDVPGTTGNPGCAACPEEFAHYTELAPEIIRQEKRASTSLLQRRLNFSFQLANALIIELERRGILGPGEGAQPREILVDLNAPL
jgi:DNA segregation ATPase FtsK/SpoIIIE-like protein